MRQGNSSLVEARALSLGICEASLHNTFSPPFLPVKAIIPYIMVKIEMSHKCTCANFLYLYYSYL